LKTTHPTTKLAPKRYGPFTIKKKVSDVIFQLELPHQWKIHNVFHTSLLTPYIETELHGPNFPKPPLEIVEGDPEFKVEQIVGSRQVGKKEDTLIQNMLEGIFPSIQLMGIGDTSTCPGTDQKVPEKQIFPKEQCHHQLPSGLGDPVKD
jgi:hypothetical protein